MSHPHNNHVSLLDQLCLIHADFDIWSGQTRLTPTDLKLGVGGEIPPEKLALLGSKKVCDPARLKGFHRLKSEARRYLLTHGMPFMNGFAVPAAKVLEITNKLDEISTEFAQLKAEFINGYSQAIDEWCTAYPEYEVALRAAVLPKHTVEQRLGFDYQAFMIATSGDPLSDGKLGQRVGLLGEELLTEVVKEASTFYVDVLAGREQCNVATRKTLRNLRDKLNGLHFLDGSLSSLVALLDRTLQSYEQAKEGRYVVAPYFYEIVASVLIMSDRNRIEQYASGSLTLEAMGATEQAMVGSAVSALVPHQSAPLDMEEEDMDHFFRNHPSGVERREEGQYPLAAQQLDDLYF